MGNCKSEPNLRGAMLETLASTLILALLFLFLYLLLALALIGIVICFIMGSVLVIYLTSPKDKKIQNIHAFLNEVENRLTTKPQSGEAKKNKPIVFFDD